MVSPTPPDFFAENANKSEHHADSAYCSDHIVDADKMVAPDHSPDAGEEEIACVIMCARDNGACEVKDWAAEERSNPHVGQALRQARAVLALFAPILAEKERRDAIAREQAETARFLQHHLDNPQPPSDALKKLFADYKAAGVQSVGLDSPFNACCYRDECRALEARALAAEAERDALKAKLEMAVAEERETCAQAAERDYQSFDYEKASAECWDYDCGYANGRQDAAAAIRSQGQP